MIIIITLITIIIVHNKDFIKDLVPITGLYIFNV